MHAASSHSRPSRLPRLRGQRRRPGGRSFPGLLRLPDLETSRRIRQGDRFGAAAGATHEARLRRAGSRDRSRGRRSGRLVGGLRLRRPPKRTPVTAATGFRIGSVSKTLTAAAAARLAQAGRLDLDAPIQRYVPSFPEKPYRVTARDLLGHNGGIRHYQGSEALSSVHYESVTDALRVFARDPLLFEPGTQHSYSSYGFDLVGAAVESISGEAFADAVRRLVLAPIGMKQTAVDDGRRHEGWATPYEVTEARKAIPAPSIDLSNRLPAGGFRSSAEDLARLGSRLGNRTFLRRPMQVTFFSEQHLADGSGTGYGLGFEVAEAPIGRVVGHTGNVVGGTAFVLAQPEAGVAIAMATNIGYVTVRTAPDLSSVPDPPALFAPFVRRALQQS